MRPNLAIASRRVLLLGALALLCCASACPKYNAPLASQASTFQQNTDAYLTNLPSLQAPACTYGQSSSSAYYQQAYQQLGQLKSLATSPKDGYAQHMVNELGSQLDDLKKLQQGKGDSCLTKTEIDLAKQEMDQIFKTIDTYETYLKNNGK